MAIALATIGFRFTQPWWLLAALVAALSFWADFQRPFVTFPFLAVLYIFELVKSTRGAPKRLGTAARRVPFALGAGVLAVMLLSFAVLPVLAEKDDCTLIPQAEIERENEASSLHNPLLPFDRNGRLTRALLPALSSQMLPNAGTYYMGAAAILLALLALVLGRKHKGVIALFLLLALGAYWISCGKLSAWQKSFW